MVTQQERVAQYEIFYAGTRQTGGTVYTGPGAPISGTHLVTPAGKKIALGVYTVGPPGQEVSMSAAEYAKLPEQEAVSKPVTSADFVRYQAERTGQPTFIRTETGKIDVYVPTTAQTVVPTAYTRPKGAPQVTPSFQTEYGQRTATVEHPWAKYDSYDSPAMFYAKEQAQREFVAMRPQERFLMGMATATGEYGMEYMSSFIPYGEKRQKPIEVTAKYMTKAKEAPPIEFAKGQAIGSLHGTVTGRIGTAALAYYGSQYAIGKIGMKSTALTKFMTPGRSVFVGKVSTIAPIVGTGLQMYPHVARKEYQKAFEIGLGGAATAIGAYYGAKWGYQRLFKEEYLKDVTLVQKQTFEKHFKFAEEAKGVKVKPKEMGPILQEMPRTKGKPGEIAIEHLAKKGDIVGGSVAARTQLYGAQRMPRDIDVFARKPAESAKALFKSYEQAGIAGLKLSVGKEGGKIFGPEGKIIEFHPESWLKSFPYTQRTLKTPEGIRVISIGEQTYRKTFGGLLRAKDWPDIKSYMPSIEKSAYLRAEASPLKMFRIGTKGIAGRAVSSVAAAKDYGYYFVPKIPSIGADIGYGYRPAYKPAAMPFKYKPFTRQPSYKMDVYPTKPSKPKYKVEQYKPAVYKPTAQYTPHTPIPPYKPQPVTPISPPPFPPYKPPAPYPPIITLLPPVTPPTKGPSPYTPPETPMKYKFDVPRRLRRKEQKVRKTIYKRTYKYTPTVVGAVFRKPMKRAPARVTMGSVGIRAPVQTRPTYAGGMMMGGIGRIGGQAPKKKKGGVWESSISAMGKRMGKTLGIGSGGMPKMTMGKLGPQKKRKKRRRKKR